MSTSSWGRELKLKNGLEGGAYNRRPPREVVSWNTIVERKNGWGRLSTSSWGRELKYQNKNKILFEKCRPPREVVSWNTACVVSLSVASRRPPREVVSWNAINSYQKMLRACRPPREVVSWNTSSSAVIIHLLVDLLVRSWVEMSLFCFCCLCCSWSTSSWGRELKFLIAGRLDNYKRRPPREVVSWNTSGSKIPSFLIVDLLVRSWVEM